MDCEKEREWFLCDQPSPLPTRVPSGERPSGPALAPSATPIKVLPTIEISPTYVNQFHEEWQKRYLHWVVFYKYWSYFVEMNFSHALLCTASSASPTALSPLSAPTLRLRDNHFPGGRSMKSKNIGMALQSQKFCFREICRELPDSNIRYLKICNVSTTANSLGVDPFIEMLSRVASNDICNSIIRNKVGGAGSRDELKLWSPKDFTLTRLSLSKVSCEHALQLLSALATIHCPANLRHLSFSLSSSVVDDADFSTISAPKLMQQIYQSIFELLRIRKGQFYTITIQREVNVGDADTKFSNDDDNTAIDMNWAFDVIDNNPALFSFNAPEIQFSPMVNSLIRQHPLFGISKVVLGAFEEAMPEMMGNRKHALVCMHDIVIHYAMPTVLTVPDMSTATPIISAVSTTTNEEESNLCQACGLNVRNLEFHFEYCPLIARKSQSQPKVVQRRFKSLFDIDSDNDNDVKSTFFDHFGQQEKQKQPFEDNKSVTKVTSMATAAATPPAASFAEWKCIGSEVLCPVCTRMISIPAFQDHAFRCTPVLTTPATAPTAAKLRQLMTTDDVICPICDKLVARLAIDRHIELFCSKENKEDYVVLSHGVNDNSGFDVDGAIDGCVGSRGPSRDNERDDPDRCEKTQCPKCMSFIQLSQVESHHCTMRQTFISNYFD